MPQIYASHTPSSNYPRRSTSHAIRTTPSPSPAISHTHFPTSTPYNAPHSHLTPHILLILPTTPHSPNHLLRLLGRNPPFPSDNLHQHGTNLTCHIRRIATDVEIRLVVLYEGVDLLGVLAQAVLDVDFLRLFAGEGRDDGEGGEVGGELL